MTEYVPNQQFGMSAKEMYTINVRDITMVCKMLHIQLTLSKFNYKLISIMEISDKYIFFFSYKLWLTPGIWNRRLPHIIESDILWVKETCFNRRWLTVLTFYELTLNSGLHYLPFTHLQKGWLVGDEERKWKGSEKMEELSYMTSCKETHEIMFHFLLHFLGQLFYIW